MTPELSPEQPPLSLSPDLLEALRTIAATEHLLVAMDFDGTMAPLVDHAGDARSLPRSAAAFAALTELPRTTTALISGRALDSLRAVAFPPEKTLLIGSPGAEVWMGAGSTKLEIDDARQELLANVDRIYDIVDACDQASFADRAAGRRTQVRSAWRAVMAVDQIFSRSGGNALRMDKPLQRYWRDAHAGLAHATHVPGNTFHASALSSLGIEPEGPLRAMI